MQIQLTHLGTATVLLEVGGLRLLTDPALDAAGQTYGFGFGTHSTKLLAPQVPPQGLGRIDAVLISHDQHADNLDDAGRALLPSVSQVLTTRPGARRLGGGAQGLAPWQTAEVRSPDGTRIRVTATPARHGPPGSLPIVGEVVGFFLEWEGQQHGGVYISGDTVKFAGVDQIAGRLKVGTALMHLGGVRFPISGPLRYTFTARDAARVAKDLGAQHVVPLHYSGWSHFQEGRTEAELAFKTEGIESRVQWLTPGVPATLDV